MIYNAQIITSVHKYEQGSATCIPCHTLRPDQIGQNLADDIFKCIFLIGTFNFTDHKIEHQNRTSAPKETHTLKGDKYTHSSAFLATHFKHFNAFDMF